MAPDSRHRRVLLLPHSIRSRLLLTTVVAIVITSALVTLVSVSMLAGYLSSRVEQRVETIATDIEKSAERAPDHVADATALRAFLPAGSFVVIEPQSGQGTVTFGSQVFDTQEIAAAAATAPNGRMKRITTTTVSDGVSTSHDVALVRVDTHDLRIRLAGLAEPVTARFVVFATDITADTKTISQLIQIEVAVGVLAAVAVALLSALFIRVGFRPLTSMAAAADSITSGERSKRLQAAGAGTETERLAASINQALDAQQRAEERLRTLMDDVSHELRTPLTTINGWIDLYLQGGLDDLDERDRAMERVEAEISRMRILVDELTLLSRLDTHRSLERVPVDLGALALEVVDDARIIDDTRNITCDAARVVVLGDPLRLAQAIRNLVGNAVQHTPEGVAVRVEVVRDHTEAALRVSDEGPGIPADELPHVFERFWRGEPSRSRTTGGSGLGLSIVSSIVEAHGGAIRVVSSGAGTTFTLSLPLAPSEQLTSQA